MSVYLKLDKYVGVDPAIPGVVYHDRVSGGVWEEIEFRTEPSKHLLVRFLSANVQLSIGNDGSLQTRPAGTSGPWEQFTLDGTSLRRYDGVGPTFEVEGLPTHAASGGFLHKHCYTLRGQPLAYFLNEQNERVFLAADTRHTLLCDNVDIPAVLDESLSHGPNVNSVIVIGCHLSDWKKANGFYLDPRAPGHQEKQAQMYDIAASKGVRVIYRALADAQGLSVSEQQKIWAQAAEVARGRWNAVLTIGNEGGWGSQGGGANGWHSSDFSRPDLGPVIVGRGSFGMDTPPDPVHWDLAEWEPRRSPTHKALDDCGAGVFELLAGYTEYPQGVRDAVVFVSEPMVFNDMEADWAGDSGRWTEPELAFRAGLNIAASGAGAGAFISSDGMVCRPLQPLARECAKQFFRGLAAAGI